MTYYIIFSVLVYVIWLFKKPNTSNYFDQSKEILVKKWNDNIRVVINDFEFSWERKAFFKTAYEFFTDNPLEFDGATVVKDITQVKGLDIPSLGHDYEYYLIAKLQGFWKRLFARLKADWRYSQDMRQFEIAWTTAYARMALLIVMNVLFIYDIIQLFKKDLKKD